MGTFTATKVAAGSFVDSAGFEHVLFTATIGSAGDTVDLSTWFENIYFIKGWDVADGTDPELFVTDGAYGNGVTATTDKDAIYIYAVGTPIRSTGGST